MNKNQDYFELTKSIALRSICNVKVGAIIYDSLGVFAWGWNNSGDGYGICAERFAIKRSNKRRLSGARIMVISVRKGKIICSMPCPKCSAVIGALGIKYVTCATADGEWLTFRM